MEIFKNWIRRHPVFTALIVLMLLFLAWFFCQEARTDRDWEVAYQKIPDVQQNGDLVTIHNIRDFLYSSTGEITPRYRDETYRVSDIVSVDFLVSHFSDIEGVAHAFVSFGFRDGRYLSISVETRREKGESFSPFWGLLRQFEIAYIVGTEEDLIGSRIGFRNEEVYLYPTVATPEQAQKLFLSFAHSITKESQNPDFYNTLTNNCTNTITHHIEKISEKKFPWWDSRLIFPGYADELALEMGLIPSGNIEELRKKYRISGKGFSSSDANFSQELRGERGFLIPSKIDD
ncbi:MAG: DUF4105 domain-containing protein [Candidatus Peregrinibacteria bacterium]